MIVNLTPHPIRIYGPDVPDRIDPADFTPRHVIEPSGTPARIGEIPLGTNLLRGCADVPVEYVEYASHGGLVQALPEPSAGTWYVVSLVVALQQTYVYNRPDVLVPYREVRNLDGTIVGCRLLARPV